MPRPKFGCSVPKVTRRGGGSALPWKRKFFREIVTSGFPAGHAGRRPWRRRWPGCRRYWPQLDATAPFPREILGQSRGRTGTLGRVVLPEGWLAG
ncbi:hypothetical protein AB0M46_01665 [Dactylosporangium sp. NPDC051485]|uniref:hypothetical protein n=1 Tax=Dactylosporangium sp. NPDC051485 TaxID=3154846 RepID=UPI0034274776